MDVHDAADPDLEILRVAQKQNNGKHNDHHLGLACWMRGKSSKKLSQMVMNPMVESKQLILNKSKQHIIILSSIKQNANYLDIILHHNLISTFSCQDCVCDSKAKNLGT